MSFRSMFQMKSSVDVRYVLDGPGEQSSPIAALSECGGGGPAIDSWLESRAGNFASIPRPWYDLPHDGQPTACVGNAAFGYVNMRHVKLRPDIEINQRALAALIQAAYSRVKSQAR